MGHHPDLPPACFRRRAAARWTLLGALAAIGCLPLGWLLAAPWDGPRPVYMAQQTQPRPTPAPPLPRPTAPAIPQADSFLHVAPQQVYPEAVVYPTQAPAHYAQHPNLGPTPAAPYMIRGVDCAPGSACGELGWGAARPLDWQPYGQGEYVGHVRTPHVPEYRLRVDDLLDVVFRLTREETSQPYRLEVGDEVRVESVADPTIDRESLIIQPDGTITLKLVGQLKATGRTVAQLRDEIEQAYRTYYQEPSITVTPLKVNTRLEDLRATVDARAGFGGQARQARVTPDGTIQLPALGAVPAQGLTLNELKRELDQRYAEQVEGIEVTPILVERAPRYVYVLGEVATPGRYLLEGPTTVMQSISLAGGWNVGGNLRQVVIFRRGDDWRLMATMLDLRGALLGKTPCPADELWVNDSDIIIVPKAPILVADDIISLVFTRGLYSILPFSGSANVGWAATF